MDLGSVGNSVAMVGFSMVGALGGYPGMLMGMSLAGYLFHGDESKEHTPYNDNQKDTSAIVKSDPVPLLVGTDICPGTVIYLDDDSPKVVDPDYYSNDALRDFEDAMPDALDWRLLHMEFLAAFCDISYAGNVDISRVWLEKFHHWLWLRFDDYIHSLHGYASSGWNPITDIILNYSWWTNYSPTPWTVIKRIGLMRFWGAMVLPTAHNLINEVYDDLQDSYKHYSVIGTMPKRFPDIKAEASSKTIYSPFGGRAIDRITTGYNHTYRDNKSDYTYGIFVADQFTDDYWSGAGCDIRRLNFYEYTYTRLVENEYAYNNITKGYNNWQNFSRQDIDGNPDHLYIVHCRNWYHANTYKHHHAEYSFKYDIFYIDRSDDSVHSVCYDQIVNVQGVDAASNPIPYIENYSMEVVGDSILLFGQEFQSHSIWHDRRTLTADDERIGHGKTRIYADFSQYPHDYWEDDTGGIYCWVYFSRSGYEGDIRERYRITEQRNDYIEVEGNFAIPHVVGDIVFVTRIRKYQAGWSIVGEGSTKSKIICNYPTPFDPVISDLNYDSLQLENAQSTGSLRWGFEIDSVNGTEINLKYSLPNDPVVGEVVWFSHEFHNDGISYPSDADYFEKFYDPHNYWFMDNLASLMCPDWVIWTDMEQKELICHDFFVYTKYSNHGLLNDDAFGKSVILRFNKSTGAFIEKIYEQDPFPARYMGTTFYVVNELCQISSVTTDDQLACSFNLTQHNAVYAINLVINKSNLNIISSWMGRHASGGPYSHAAGRVYRGAVKVNAYGDSGYQERWYALAVEFRPHVDEYNFLTDEYLRYDNSNMGHYLLDLGVDGDFPDASIPLSPTESGVYSSILNVDANAGGMIKWYRPEMTTGPLYSPFFISNASTFRDSQNMRMYDYDEKLFFVIQRSGYVSSYGETWCFMMPNEWNQTGFSWPVAKEDKYWARDLEGWDDEIRTSKYLIEFGDYGNRFSNYVDATIEESVEVLMSQAAYGSHIYVPIEEQDYPNEIIDDVVIYKGKIHNIREPRFLFSLCWSRKKPLGDMLNDILSTCQGYLVRYEANTWQSKIRFPRDNEPVQWYLGYHRDDFVVSINSGAYDRIYLDLSNYPDNYWRGDSGIITIGLNEYQFEIEEQTSTHIDLLSGIAELSSINDEVILIKDNIVEGSFAYSKKPQYDRSNRMRIEFINRLTEYKIDIAEADYHYKQEIIDKRVILRHYEMHGIKRGTQAARMALRLLDYEQFVNWMCSFRTDQLGHYFVIGDIIAVTHPVTGWIGKQFRVIRKEEQVDHEVLIETEEYVPSIYHDYSNPIYQGGGGGSTGVTLPITDQPNPVRRLQAYYDSINNRVYISFSKPVDDWSMVGANIYVSIDDGTTYTLKGMAVNSIASVVYSQYPGTNTPSDMEPTRTKYNEMSEVGYHYTEIPYDPLTMVGTFPASGYLWVNGELIYYHGIDTVNYKFVNCIRCIEVPEYQYAVDAPDDGYDWTNPLITLADTSNSFYFTPDLSLVDLTAEALQTEGSEIEYDIPSIKIKAVSVNVAGASGYDTNAPVITIKLRAAMGRPYSPTLLRYERDL